VFFCVPRSLLAPPQGEFYGVFYVAREYVFSTTDVIGLFNDFLWLLIVAFSKFNVDATVDIIYLLFKFKMVFNAM